MCKCNACVWSWKRIGRIRWSQKQGSMWFPRALCKWIGPHVVKMEALPITIKSKQFDVVGRLALLKFEVNWCLWHTVTIVCVWLTFPPYRSSNQPPCLCTSMMIETWCKLLTKCICHCELRLPGSYGCPMIGEAEVSSYNAMSACKCTFDLLHFGVQFDAYDMVWTAGTAEWACQKETF